MHGPFLASKIGLMLLCLVFLFSELEAPLSFTVFFDSVIFLGPPPPEIINIAYKNRR